MKKNMIKKALALLVILAMMIPFMPVIASAEGENTEPESPYVYKERTVTADDIAAWKAKAANNVYPIADAHDLACFAACTDIFYAATSAVVQLTADITWNDGTVVDGKFVPNATAEKDEATGKPIIYTYTPAGITKAGSIWNCFRATFDGNGKTITGLYTSMTTTVRLGFICAIGRGGTIKNVSFDNCYMESSHTHAAMAVGHIMMGGVATVENITVSSCYVSSENYTAAIAGASPTSTPGSGTHEIYIRNCVVDADTVLNCVNANAAENTYKAAIMGQKFSHGVMTLSNNINYTGLNLVGLGGGNSTSTKDCVSVTNGTVVHLNSTENSWSGTSKKLDAPATGVMSMEVEGVQTKTNATDNTKFDARFVASIDLGEVSTEGTLVGFEFAQVSEMVAETPVVQIKGCETVYKSITTSFGGSDLTAASFDADYLATLVITGIPASGTQSILIRSWYKLAGGEKQYGNYALVTFVNGAVRDSSYVTEYVPAE